MRHKHVEQVKAEIVKHGGTIDRVTINGHIKIWWSYQGNKLIQVLPATPTDWRGVKNALAHVRRMVRNTHPHAA